MSGIRDCTERTPERSGVEYTPEGRSVERSILQGASSGAERSILHKIPERSEFRSAPAFLQFLAIQNFSAPFGGRKVPQKIFCPPSAAENFEIFSGRSEIQGRSGAELRSEARSGAEYTPEKNMARSAERSILQWPERGAERTPEKSGAYNP